MKLIVKYNNRRKRVRLPQNRSPQKYSTPSLIRAIRAMLQATLCGWQQLAAKQWGWGWGCPLYPGAWYSLNHPKQKGTRKKLLKN